MNPAEYRMLHAQWEVLWAKPEKGGPRIVAIDFENDFVGARNLFLKAKKAGKPMATLRCKNVGFPPPEKVLEKIIAYNKQRIWWCPYCMELRRFEKRAWAEIDGHLFSTNEAAYYCPVCDISHRDAHVIKYNPIAQRLMYGRKSRGKKGKRSGKRRR